MVGRVGVGISQFASGAFNATGPASAFGICGPFSAPGVLVEMGFQFSGNRAEDLEWAVGISGTEDASIDALRRSNLLLHRPNAISGMARLGYRFRYNEISSVVKFVLPVHVAVSVGPVFLVFGLSGSSGTAVRRCWGWGLVEQGVLLVPVIAGADEGSGHDDSA